MPRLAHPVPSTFSTARLAAYLGSTRVSTGGGGNISKTPPEAKTASCVELLLPRTVSTSAPSLTSLTAHTKPPKTCISNSLPGGGL
eukprot:7391143-Prymnesium_polylepis.1